MDSLKNVMAGLLAMIFVMALGFTGKISQPAINLIVYVLFIAVFFIGSSLKACSKRVNVVKQYDTVVAVEPKSESMFFVRAYHFLYFSLNSLIGALMGSLILLISLKGMH
jgi:hypothetical protein